MKNYKVTFLGVLLSFALILSYIESLIPFFIGIPGMKLGLANLAVLLTLYCYGGKEAAILNIMRVLLAGFLFGNLYTLVYSGAGAIVSLSLMMLMKKAGKFSMTGVSIGGGVFHNVGQIAVAAFVIDSWGVFYYLPALLTAGVVTGALIGVLAALARPYIDKIGRVS